MNCGIFVRVNIIKMQVIDRLMSLAIHYEKIQGHNIYLHTCIELLKMEYKKIYKLRSSALF